MQTGIVGTFPRTMDASSSPIKYAGPSFVSFDWSGTSIAHVGTYTFQLKVYWLEITEIEETLA